MQILYERVLTVVFSYRDLYLYFGYDKYLADSQKVNK